MAIAWFNWMMCDSMTVLTVCMMVFLRLGDAREAGHQQFSIKIFQWSQLDC